MKKRILLIVLIGMGLSIKAQNTFPANGSVGIGTSTPSIWFNNHLVEIKNNRPVLKLNSTGTLGTVVFTNALVSSNHYGEFHFNHTYLNSDPSKSTFKFASYPAGNILTLQANGNVGIGTITPDTKLSVNGIIHTREVKVDLIGWSDFVFEKYYNLPTLTEVEKHIKENGHLKDIPSAKEVAENGIYLGEMNSKLLQKIEELTLYTIQQGKEIKSLKSMNSKLIELQKRLEKLEKK